MTDLEGRVSGLEKIYGISVENHIGHQTNGSGYNEPLWLHYGL